MKQPLMKRALGWAVIGSLALGGGFMMQTSKAKTKSGKKENPAASADVEQQEESDLTLLFTGETDGYLKPCGCVSFQLGGLERRKAHVDHLSTKADRVFSVSNGSLFEGPGRQNELEATVIAQAYDAMDYEVVNFTETEMAYGADYLMNLFSPIAGVQFVSANFTPMGYESLITPFHTKTVEIDGKPFEVAITGAMDPSVFTGVYGDGMGPQTSPEAGIREVLPQMEGADYKVLLFMGRHDDGIALAETFPEFDVVVTGYQEDAPARSPKMVGDTYVIKTGRRGKNIAGIALHDVGSEQQRSSYLFVEVTDEHGEDDHIVSLIKAHQQKVSDLKLMEARAETEEPMGGTYIGTMACSGCHQDEYKIWQHTRHEEAYETLKEINSHRDPECIGCHVVGYPKRSGFVNYEQTAHLVDVGCENCHGPGSNHIVDPTKPYKNASIEQCRTCHYDEHDPNFSPEKWDKIQHGPELNEMMLKRIMSEKDAGSTEEQQSAY